MKELNTIKFDKATYQRELTNFEQMLTNQTALSESNDILPFFKRNPQLAAQIGSLAPQIFHIDQIAFEFDVFGDFRCDLIVGNSQTHRYCFIEFEDATEKSIFIKKNDKYQPEFAPRFERGYSQVADWFYKLHNTSDADLEQRFGTHHIEYSGILIIGRSSYLSPNDKRRLRWRHKFTLVDSKNILAITFDELLVSLKTQLFPIADST
jgi:Domain of unknown function (DUF4263)